MIVSCRWGRLEPGELDVLEAVEGEPGRPGFLALALADVGVDAPGRAEVGGVDRAVGVEPLGEPQGDLLARLALDLQPGHAGEVLAQVEHEDARLRLGDRTAGHGPRLNGRTGGPGWAWTAGLTSAPSDNRLPLGVVETRRCPSRAWPAGRRRFRPSGSRPRGSARSRLSSPGRWRRRRCVPSVYSRWSMGRSRGCLP